MRKAGPSNNRFKHGKGTTRHNKKCAGPASGDFDKGLGEISHVVWGQAGVDSDQSLCRKIEAAAHLVFWMWPNQVRAGADRKEMDRRGEALLCPSL